MANATSRRCFGVRGGAPQNEKPLHVHCGAFCETPAYPGPDLASEDSAGCRSSIFGWSTPGVNRGRAFDACLQTGRAALPSRNLPPLPKGRGAPAPPTVPRTPRVPEHLGRTGLSLLPRGYTGPAARQKVVDGVKRCAPPHWGVWAPLPNSWALSGVEWLGKLDLAPPDPRVTKPKIATYGSSLTPARSKAVRQV